MASYSTIAMALLLCGFLGPDTNRNVDATLNTWDIHEMKITNARKEMNLKQMCDENGGAGAFENVQRAMTAGRGCIDNFMGMAKLSKEMEATYARTGDLHLMFKIYCPNTPHLMKCVINAIAPIESCLDPQRKDSMKVIENVIDALLSFACFKDGDRIVQFMSANGLKCLKSKEQEVQHCVNTTFGFNLPALNPNDGLLAASDRLSIVAFGAEDCARATTFQSCIVKKLEECSDPEPASFVDSIFNVMLRATPCKEYLPNSAVSTSTINLMATSIVFLLLRLI